MAEINIPGVSSHFNTNKIVEDLMKVEKAPLTKMENRVDELNSEKNLWRGLNTKMNSLSSQCSTLYNYDNPFGERLVHSSNEAVTATAIRNADLTQHSVRVIQTASADKLISSPIVTETKLSPGHYIFKIGEKKVSYFFNGGTPKNFVDGLNRRAPDLLRAQIIQAKPGEQVILLESQITGAANSIQFEGDAISLAQQIGWVQDKVVENTNSSQKIQIGAYNQSNPYNISRAAEECLVNPGEQIQIPLALSGEKTLSLNVKAIDLSKNSTFQQQQRPLEMGVIGSASFRDVTLTNEVSILPTQGGANGSNQSIAAENPSELLDIIIIGQGGERRIPLTQPIGISQNIQLSSKELNGTFDSIRLYNRSKGLSLLVETVEATDSIEGLNPQKTTQAIENARDAIFEYDGIKLTRSKNLIDDVNEQIAFTLHAPTSTPVSLKVETNKEVIKDKVIEFAYHYNKLIEEMTILHTNDEKVIDELSYLEEGEREQKRETLGALQGDMTIIQIKNRLSQIINNSYDIQSNDQISMLYQLGIGSNLSSYSGYSAARLRGYLEVDESKLDHAIENNITDLQKLFGYDTNDDFIVDNGVAFLINQYLSSFSKQGGIIDGKMQSYDRQIAQQEKDITNFNERMEKKESDYKRQFGNMEAMYERLKDSSRALDSLGTSKNE